MESKDEELELLSGRGGAGIRNQNNTSNNQPHLCFDEDPTKRIDFVLAYHHKHVNEISGRRTFLDNYLKEMEVRLSFPFRYRPPKL